MGYGGREAGGLSATLAAMASGTSSSPARGRQGADIVEGLESLLHVLGAMEKRASRRVLRGALRYGMAAIGTAIRKEAKQPLRGGSNRQHIPKAIGTRVGKDREGLIVAKAGVWVGNAKRRQSDDNWWAHILAMGSGPRKRYTQRNASTGTIVAEDFVQRGYALSAHTARARIAERARALMGKEIARAKNA